MPKFAWLFAIFSVSAATGVDALPTGSESLELGLLKALASSGVIGSFLVWYVYTGRRDLVREREEASKRENRLADRLNLLEDEIRTGLVAVLQDTKTAIQEFKAIAQRCRELHEHERDKS